MTINGTTWKPEPEIGTNGYSQTKQNPKADEYKYMVSLPRHSGLGL
jgi:hypothetical protein